MTGTTGVTVVQPPPPGSNYVLPPDRATTWRPGVTYAGGIPTRSTVCANVPAGASAAAVQTAVDNCPAGQVVQLAAGTYTWNGGTFVTIDKGVTVRGAGANSTLIRKTDGAVAGVDGTGGNASPLVVLGPSRYGNQSNGVAGATNLTADALKGTYAVTVASTTGLAAGQLVLLDELSGAGWRTDPQGRGQVWAAPDWRVVWQLHNPGQPTDDPLALPANVSTSGRLLLVLPHRPAHRRGEEDRLRLRDDGHLHDPHPHQLPHGAHGPARALRVRGDGRRGRRGRRLPGRRRRPGPLPLVRLVLGAPDREPRVGRGGDRHRPQLQDRDPGLLRPRRRVRLAGRDRLRDLPLRGVGGLPRRELDHGALEQGDGRALERRGVRHRLQLRGRRLHRLQPRLAGGPPQRLAHGRARTTC